MSIGTMGGMTFSASTFSTAANPSSSLKRNAKTTTSQEVLADFRAEVKKTPVDRIRERILKSHGLSQDTFDALPADKQAGIMKEIQEAIKQALGAKGQASALGTKADVIV